MQMNLSDEHARFREEVIAFLDEKFTPELRDQASRQAGVFAEPDLGRAWQRILFERGWGAPSWPKEYGGTGWDGIQRYIFASECAKVSTPRFAAMGIALCGPVIMKYGTQEQKDFFLPKMLSAEHYWCQGYSEPQSGSDLASVKTRAERDGDEYVVNGTKIWTTHAHAANWIFMLVRTSIEDKKQKGLSFMVAPMDTPGISVTPIISMSGEHEVNQVFLDNVRVPVANRMGEEGEGWSVAKYLLEFERGGDTFAAGLHSTAGRARKIGSQESDGLGGELIEEPAFRRKMDRAEIDLLAYDWTERRLTFGKEAGQSVGAYGASIKKLMSSELKQRLEALAVEGLGAYAAPSQQQALGSQANEPPIGPDYAAIPTARFLNGRATTIFGGSAEIQRNILAKAMGL